MKQVEALGRKGDTAGLQALFQQKGYRMGGTACGMIASKYAKDAGFKPPEGGAVATNWRNFGVASNEEDINKEGRPFGSMFATSKTGTYGSRKGQALGTGQTGGHVMTIVPGTYDPKTHTADTVDQYGFKHHKWDMRNMDVRYAGDAAVAAAEARRTGGQVATGGDAGGQSVGDSSKAGSDRGDTMKELSAFVRGKESFRSTPFPDFGTTGIGYGTPAAGRTSITEPEARKETEGVLAKNLENVDKLNPNLSQGQRIALASLDYNTGFTGKDSEKNRAFKDAIKRGDMKAAREMFATYNHAGGRVIGGLTSRRQEELQGFWDRPDKDSATADRKQIDKTQSASTKVEGSGKISVDVNAPKGTKVGAEGKGLFKDVEVNRQTQMEPARRGPTRDEGAMSI
jgi:GH24 family phage-related lysozyme (muramidase)